MADTSILDRAEQFYLDKMARRHVPEHLREGLARYLLQFIKPGDFLTAVLENNLKEAFVRADENSRAGIWHLMAFLYHDAPGTSWGSPDRVREWLANRPKEIA